jgi:hypothetical protein
MQRKSLRHVIQLSLQRCAVFASTVGEECNDVEQSDVFTAGTVRWITGTSSRRNFFFRWLLSGRYWIRTSDFHRVRMAL